MKYKIMIIALIIGILPCILISATLSVKQDGSGDYNSIQAALDAAHPGDVILVYPGRYFEHIVITTNNISLMSMEGDTGDPSYIETTIVDGDNAGICIASRAQNATIRGFSITNGFSTGGGAGVLIRNETHLINCDIYNNTARIGAGINIRTAKSSFSGVTVRNNYSFLQGGGFYIFGHNQYYPLEFDPDNRCSIYDNRAGAGQDIFTREASINLDMPLHTFSVQNPTEYYVKYLHRNIVDSIYHINFDILNAHHQEIDSDLYVSTDGDDANDGLSPETALKTIHEAIYRTASNSENQNSVFIMPGEYSNSTNGQKQPIALKSWVKVQGSGIGVTTFISEPHPIPRNIANAVFSASAEPHIFIDGMSITAQGYIDNHCAAICAADCRNTNVHFSNLHIYDLPTTIPQDTPSIAYAVAIGASSESESIIENVIIENFEAGDYIILEMVKSKDPDGQPSAFRGQIKNCIFRNATNNDCDTDVWGSPIINIRIDRELLIENCQFSNLIMHDDDAMVIQVSGTQYPQQQNHLTLKNCLISNNVSAGGDQFFGGILKFGTQNNPRIDIINCTFVGNQSDTYSLRVNGVVNITNTIFDNDSTYQIMVGTNDNPNEYTHLTLDHCMIKDGIDGIRPYLVPRNTIDYRDTNIELDPMFVGGDDQDDPLRYSLSEYSPCIDSGTPDIEGLNLPPYDLAGNRRVWNGRIDMGCFEYGSEPWVSNEDELSPVLDHLILHQNYPNPFNPETTISFEIKEAGQVSLRVYNMRGQLVRTVADETMPSGLHSRIWDGLDDRGCAVASGIYLYRISSGKQSISKKMIMMK